MNPLHIEVIDREFAAILAAKSPAERVAMVGEANRMARILAEAGARLMHPDWSDAQIQLEIVRRLTDGSD